MWIGVDFQIVTLGFVLQMPCVFFKTAYTTFIERFFNLYKVMFKIYLTLHE